jgi:hypothetical protein
VTWNTTQTANGSHVLTASARDVAGNTATSTPVTLTVNNDTTPPTVSITSPVNNSSVIGSISVTANASDDVAVLGVRFRLDGVDLGTEDTTSPYAVTWNAATATNGTHVLSAVARDAAGNSATSSVTVMVANPIAYFPASYSVTTGAYQSGTAASLTADDNNYLVVRSTTSGATRQSVADLGFIGVAAATRLDYTVRLRSSASNTTITIFALNFVTGTWTQIGKSAIGTSETTLSASLTTSAASYVSPDGRVTVRIQSSRTNTHSISDDLIKLVVTP